MKPAEELSIREGVRDTLHAYAWAADRGDRDALVGLFVDDGVLAVAEQEYAGRDAIRGLLEGAGRRLAEARDEAGGSGARIRHHVANVVFDEVTAGEARVRCYFLALTPAGADHWGQYTDHLRREPDGVWRFVRREAQVVGRGPGSAFASG